MKIEELKISLKDKRTKEIRYEYDLEDNYWFRFEYDKHGNMIYMKTHMGVNIIIKI